jgi:3-dehydroquinate synthase
MPDRRQRIVLTGFSGTGKSAVAPLIAKSLDWDVVDTDEIVEREAGKAILEIFRDEGEGAFRERESAALREACAHSNAVISTGGGAVLRPANRRLMAEAAFIVCLEARPETILRRLQNRADDRPLDRPLLATGNPLERIRELKEARQNLYALSDWSVLTDLLTPEEVAAEVVDAWERFSAVTLKDPFRIHEISSEQPSSAATVTLHAVSPDAAATVFTSTGAYPVHVKWGLLSELGARLREAGLARHVYVITDEAVAHHYEDEVETALRAAEIEFDIWTIPPGESSKTMATASSIYDRLLEQKAERGHTIVAVGGGVVTDLGGYVAATFARGLPLVHVPTSLLGMVDAAIGGKVAVNHPKAKNMIGAFYQPRMVLSDPATLRTLPPREVHSGWAEALKHALIADEGYLRYFEENAEAVLKLQPDATTRAISRSVEIKAGIVSQDERETLGRRSLLNYGHTLAHAIESTTGYTRFRHGEADGIGMTAAAAMSVRIGMLDPAEAERQRRLLERYGLPTKADGLNRADLMAAIALDKKVQGKSIRWVLLERIGKAVLRDDVSPEVVQAALDEVLA